ncbi:MAG TPA: BmrU protein, partial [Clostridiales bacterium]|nr:BmrU protein [Clostridiales bacterium]
MGAYVLSLLVNVLGRPLSRPMEVEMGAVSYTGPVTLVCVCNGRYYGGG